MTGTAKPSGAATVTRGRKPSTKPRTSGQDASWGNVGGLGACPSEASPSPDPTPKPVVRSTDTRHRYTVAEYVAEIDPGQVTVEIVLDGRAEPLGLVFHDQAAVDDFCRALQIWKLRAWALMATPVVACATPDVAIETVLPTQEVA